MPARRFERFQSCLPIAPIVILSPSICHFDPERSEGEESQDKLCGELVESIREGSHAPYRLLSELVEDIPK